MNKKIDYGNPYDPYDEVWKDEDRFNNAMFDIGESFESYEDESPYQSTEEQEQDDASD